MKPDVALDIVLTIARDSLECIDPDHLNELVGEDTNVNEAFGVVSTLRLKNKYFEITYNDVNTDALSEQLEKE